MMAVAVSCPSAASVDAAVALARGAGEVEEVVRPVPPEVASRFKLAQDGCGPHSFLVVYKTVKQAMEAVAKLHRQPVVEAPAAAPGAAKGGKKQQQQQQQRQGKGQQGKGSGGGSAGSGSAAAAGATLWARQVSGEGLHLKRWRLVVRNLPFSATEGDLYAAFDPAGFVWQLTLPRTPEGKPRGFAFVGFTSRASAERGMRLVNGQKLVGRPVAVDWAVAKAQYDAAAEQQAAVAAAAPGGGQQVKRGQARGGAAAHGSGEGSESDEEEAGVEGPAAANGRRRKLVSSAVPGPAVLPGASSCDIV